MEQSNQSHKLEYPSPSASWADWLVAHRKTASLITFCIIILLVGAVWAIQKQKAREMKDFETADVLAEELQKNPALFTDRSEKGASANSALEELRALTDAYSVLQSRFDSLIAEEEMLLDSQTKVDPYAERAILRMRNIGLNDFADFSEISRLASLHKYNEALTLATTLKTRLKENMAKEANAADLIDERLTTREFLLQGFLLLRIVALNQKLGNFEPMMQAIVELKDYLGLSPRPRSLTKQEKELASTLIAHLQERQSSLLEFFELPAQK